MLDHCESEPQLLQQPAIVAQARSKLLRVLEDCFSNFDSQHGADIPDSRQRLVHCAIQHVMQSDGQTSAWGMAQAVGASQKTLELAFRDVLRTTPGKYLVLNRLNQAHHSLAYADKSSTRVIDVAMSLGFSHMGRFAGAYRVLFGELPSQTLER
jgi:transcriptional regulator GlxA family with amidase domain